MRYAGILKNDFVNGIGVCVSYWSQGCPYRCPWCHNPQTWDFNGGFEADENEIINHILTALNANGVMRGLSLLGGEPLCDENLPFIVKLITKVKEKFPKIKIYCWSGATLKQLEDRAKVNQDLRYVLNSIDMLAAGPFVAAERDITLPFVGSRNQKVYFKDNKGEFYEKHF